MVDSHKYCLAFSEIICKQWNSLSAFTSAQGFERNQVIYAMGDPPEAMYLIELKWEGVQSCSHAVNF